MEYIAKVTREHEVTAQQICDLVVTAFEGGSNYWIDKARLGWPGALDAMRIGLVLAKPWYATTALYETRDWSINVFVSEEDGKAYILDRASAEHGLRILGAEYHDHLLEIIEDNADANTADAFLQCALFGEIVFG